MTAFAARVTRFPLRQRLGAVRLPSGISAIIVKELRGRMRGKRAFIVLTIHVLLLAAFAWMFQKINEESISNFGGGGFGGGSNVMYASASVGRGVFTGLLFLQTLMVAVLAPAATAGAISSEREHQTLELLAVTPISSLAIVLGKLLSALAWVFVLILASIPITALVFVFGGVAPDDVFRGYLVLFVTVIAFGSVGIFFSTLTRRTGASTGLTFVATLGMVVGSIFLFFFLTATADINSNGLRKQPSEAILYLNPFVAQADVLCGIEDGGFSGTCGFMSGVLTPVANDLIPPDVDPTKPVPMPPMPGVDAPAGLTRGGFNVALDESVAAAELAFRDRFWPKSVISMLVLAAVCTLLSVQFVTPTRRWRPSLPGPVRRLIRKRSNA